MFSTHVILTPGACWGGAELQSVDQIPGIRGNPRDPGMEYSLRVLGINKNHAYAWALLVNPPMALLVYPPAQLLVNPPMALLVNPPMALLVNPPAQLLVNPHPPTRLLVNPPIHGMEPDRRLVNLYSLRLLEPDLLSVYALLLQTIHRHQGGTTCRRSGRPVARLVVAFLEPDLEKIDHEPQFWRWTRGMIAPPMEHRHQVLLKASLPHAPVVRMT